MTLTDAIALGTLFLLLISGFANVSYRLGNLTLKVDTIWGFLIRRAHVDLLKIGWGEAHSPVTINARGLAAVEPFLDKFLPFYIQLISKNPKISNQEMFQQFEIEFGDFIMEKICIPNKISEGACILAIMQACRITGKANG